MMHIIESEEVAKTLTTLAPLTTLSRKDAHYTYYRQRAIGHPAAALDLDGGGGEHLAKGSNRRERE